MTQASAMAGAPPPLPFNTEFDPATGRPVAVAPGVVRVTAPNAGPFTFTGTNSFIVGDGPVAVIDPGPDDDDHFEALLTAIAGRPVDAILLTHTHNDHCALARRLRVATGAPLWFEGRDRPARPLRRRERDPLAGSTDRTLVPDRVLADGERFIAGGVVLEAIATPGHAANHMAFGLAGSPFLLSGDHVMGWSSTLVAPPGGSMAAYLDSLVKVIGGPHEHYLPAHGGPIAEGSAYAQALLAHREARNRQVVAAVNDGARTFDELTRRIYPTIAPKLRPAARLTLEAHVEYLAASGLIAAESTAAGARLSAIRPA